MTVEIVRNRPTSGKNTAILCLQDLSAVGFMDEGGPSMDGIMDVGGVTNLW